MSIYEYDQEEHIRLEREDAREEGKKEGIEQGITLGENQKLRSLVQKKLAKGHSAEQIADALEEEIGIIEKIIEELMQKH